jgi:2-keto-4-pentenoate hydratase/2-oxohepta-3-ene-1,7-dioic acid hydratase in catechol pathway
MAHVQVRGRREPVTIGKIVCLGANYAGHNKEMGRDNKPEAILFLKPTTAIIREGQPIVLPAFSTEVHHEVELVLLLGKGGKRISASGARSLIAAIGIGLDMTARDVQRAAKQHGLPWTMGKGFDTSAALSEFVPLTDDIDPDDLPLSLTVNGEVRQQARTSDMIHNTSALIAYISRFFTLEAGDLIYTGTPEGVGLVKAGDRLRISLGDLVNAEFGIIEELPGEKC